MYFVKWLIISSILFCCTAQAKDGWQKSKEEAGIQVFVRHTAGSAVKSFKGIVSLPASLSAVVAVIEDTQVYPRLLHNCKSAKELKEVSDKESYTYIVTGLPWPVSSRDAIVHSLLKQDKKTGAIMISMNAVANYIPLKPGLVRIKKMKGHWLLIPEKESTKVVYEMSVDPGGNLPKWLVNSMSVDMPLVTLKNLRELVKLPKYAKSRKWE